MELIEIVLISTPKYEWVNPEIEDILEWEVKHPKDKNNGKWALKNLSRVVIKNDKKEKTCLLVYSEELKNNLMPEDELYSQLGMMLFDDVWSPGGEQFCWTEFGAIISDMYGSSFEIAMISQEANIYLDINADYIQWGPKNLYVKNKDYLKYKNFADYAANDPKYLMKAIKGELHKTQSKLTFADGSTYHVTRAGGRYWENKDGKLHREDGPSAMYPDGRFFYYLNSKHYDIKEEWEIAKMGDC